MRLLESAGPAGLTLRALAKELRGSITLVTHIYPTRRDLLNAIAEGLIEQYDTELPALEVNAPPRERLWILLEWMLPLSDDAWRQERARIQLVSDMDAESAGVVADKMDTRMRELIRDRLRPLIEPSEINSLVDVLRAITDGIILATVEHRHMWPPERQLNTLRTALRALNLSVPE
ncbi:TetR/AcrR family transcriptional regulator [Agrobacterium tumefaciens]|uniref:TetR/AcrR family transcriptional regulator n=1 Tax=Agrobacterium tumefaciens TaxID=358 RepID=UPI001574A5ED|nr:TetR/AcrR family transcriptional regulator [Agrobacterium tumefaciens]NTE68241.1 TetR/AcrR family transcriptional regulator [Agrobacterium tumefaciens]